MSSNLVDAWVLYPGRSLRPGRAELVRQSVDIGSIGDNELLGDVLFGSWEANMAHAMQRSPIDVCRHRREAAVVLGNAGVIRVTDIGERVSTVRVGDHVIVFPNGQVDRWGYPILMLGYDFPGRSGCLAKRIRLTEDQAIPIPKDTAYSLVQWAAFSAKYITAWSNWELAHGVFRLQVPEHEFPSPHVWGWGGGTTLAELQLALRLGCRTAMLSGTERNLDLIASAGITAIDRRSLSNLSYDEKRLHSDLEYRVAYTRAEEDFVAEVSRRTEGEMVQIFVDYVGAPVYRATLRVLSREGVVTTAGWKKGMELSHLRATECISRHQHIYTHYASRRQGLAAVAYAETNDWMPTVSQPIYAFDEIPNLAEEYERGNTGYFPCYAVNGD
jgi:NADPH:quinone reductase-like Zn-dependent oxidoreductase